MIMPQMPESCLNAVFMGRRYAVLLFTWLSSSDPVGHKEEEKLLVVMVRPTTSRLEAARRLGLPTMSSSNNNKYSDTIN